MSQLSVVDDSNKSALRFISKNTIQNTRLNNKRL